MGNYATQMEAARKGIQTEELKKVAAKEHMTPEELMPLVAEGKVVICANKKSDGSCESGSSCDYGFVFSWRYYSIS